MLKTGKVKKNAGPDNTGTTSKTDRAEGKHDTELHEQLKMAGQVQRDFLPKKLPNSKNLKWAALFKPADWVAGDIYDVARIDEQHIAFYVADAVGHSMPAALLTMFLKQAIVMRETIGEHDYRIFSPLDVVTALNAKMSQQKLNGCLFATCCYCLLNIRTLQLSFTRAGHPYPILIRQGTEPVQLESSGGLLGVFADAYFQQETIQLQQGDKLLIYSDGLESVIGNVSQEGFVFSNDFKKLAQKPIEQMIGLLGKAAEKAQKTKHHSSKDDITAVGLEIR